MNIDVISVGRSAADDLLVEVFGFPISKAGKAANPLSPTGFDALVIDLLLEIQKVAYGPEKDALDKALEKLDVDWPNMTKAQRSAAIADAADTFLGLAKDIAPKVGKAIQGKAPAIVLATKAAASKKFKLSIEPSFNALDERIVKAAATHQAHFIRDQYGVRSKQFSQTARSIVASGLEEGIDRYKIGEELFTTLSATSAERSRSYFQLIASVFSSRSVTFATLSSFTEAGIQSFTFEAVLDEVTTEICRFLHGQTFSVKAGVSRYEEVAAESDPEMVKELQPWASVGKTEDGGAALFYKSGGERKPIAAIDVPAYGMKDKVGTYSKAMSPAEIQAAGLSCPPLHGHCRSNIVPGDGPAPIVSVPAAVVSTAPTTPAVPIPVSTSPPPGPPPAPVPLPANLSSLVRPVGTRSVDNETLPTLTAAEVAAQAAKEHKQKLIDALENATDYGPVVQAPASLGLPKGYIAHGLQVAPKDPVTGKPTAPYKASALTGQKLAGAKKSKPQKVFVNDLIVGQDHVYGKVIADAIKNPNFDPNDVILVKYEDKLYVYTGSKYVAAAKITDNKTIEAKIIDLDKPAKKPKPTPVTAPAVTAAPTPPPPVPTPVAVPVVTPPAPKPSTNVDADTVLYQKTGSNKGSNDGGFYTGKDGVNRYVKFYADPSQAHCEHLANTIYKDLGLGAPSSVVFDNKGKPAYASVIFQGGKTIKDAGLNADRAKKFLEGFVADVLTGNWDAIGTGYDNAMVLPDGRVVRIDNGGTFLFRAQAGRKPETLLDKITEWDVFFSSKNPYYSQTAAAAGVSSPEEMEHVVIAGIKAAVSLRDQYGGWDAYVRQTVPGVAPDDHKKIVNMLEARTTLLQGKLAELLKPKPPPPPPGSAKYLATSFTGDTPRTGLRIHDLKEHNALGTWKKENSKPGKLPSGESHEDYKKRAHKNILKAPQEQRDAINRFTNGTYGALRESEEKGTPNKDSNLVTQAFKHVEPEPGTVFRGIKLHGGIPQAIRDTIIEQFLTMPEWGLGKAGVGATSSTSWNVDVAKRFIGGDHDPPVGEARILFKLNGKTQIPIETISDFKSECELLLSRETRFRTTSIYRQAGCARVIVIEAEEIVNSP